MLKRAISQAQKGAEVDFEALIGEEAARVSAHYAAVWCARLHIYLAKATPWRTQRALTRLSRAVSG